MSSKFTEIRSQSTQIQALETAPTGDNLQEGTVYFDPTGYLYAYVNGAWRYVVLTSTSTSTSSSTSSSTSTSSTSTSSTSTSTSSTSTSSTSSSTSSTLW